MGTEWHSISEDKLTQFIEKTKDRFLGQTLSSVESIGFVPGVGAFVLIENKGDAEALFLSDVVVIQCRYPMESYEEALAGEFSQACFVSAESKTADIEKKLISGVHGPKECIFVEIQ
ncbi:MAG: hypothetical protein DRJ08_07095 [Acidobacteria bacterium]|nr:MAG: hypothetical protein DRJ08_07095 [Acidobacteriota bacterium]